MLRFREFLLEYNEDKNWEIHGPKITERLESQGVHENHKEFWNKQIQDHDPTRNKEYGQWISRTYANGGIKHHEDIGSRIGPALEKYHKAKVSKKLSAHGISADINTHKTLSHLEDSVEKLPQEETDSKKISNDEVTKHDEKHWTVITPHTEAASQKYGKGTRWCTAADKNCMFDHYHKNGPLHIYIPKNPKHPGEKYQVHTNTLSFMDEKDRPIDDTKVFKDRPSPHYEEHGINDEHITKALNSRNTLDRYNAINHPRSNEKHIEQALKDSASMIRSAALDHPKLSEKHLDSIFDSGSSAIKRMALSHKKINVSHLTKAMQDPESNIRAAAIGHQLSNRQHLETAIKDPNHHVVQEAVWHNALTSKDIDTLIKHKSPDVRALVFQRTNLLQPKHVNAGMNDPDYQVRRAAISSPLVDEKHVLKALDDESPIVSRSAFNTTNKNAITNRVISKALNHKDQSVRIYGIQQSHATPEHISKALDDESERIRYHAAEHANSSSDNIFKALSDSSKDVRDSASKNPNLNADHVNHIINNRENFLSSTIHNLMRSPLVNSKHLKELSKDPKYEKEAKRFILMRRY